MIEQKIEPHKVTKPMQLLAAWLVGLILTNTIFLTSALHLEAGSWERGMLVIASIANVPIFLLALFILQTRFRAELQEDTYYSEYLSKKTAEVIRIDKNSLQDNRIEELERRVLKTIEANPIAINPHDNNLDWEKWSLALNFLHPNYKKIREALISNNLPLSEIYGINADSEAPSKWIISLSYKLPFEHQISLLKILLPFGFDGIQFWEPHRDADENEDVYIGSYFSENEKYALITAEFHSLISNPISQADLKLYYSSNNAKLKN